MKIISLMYNEWIKNTIIGLPRNNRGLLWQLFLEVCL